MPQSKHVYHTCICNNLITLFKNMTHISANLFWLISSDKENCQFKQGGRRQKTEHKHLPSKASENKRARCTKYTDQS